MFFFAVKTLYFFLPAYFANMTPPVLRKLRAFEFLAGPVDFGKNLNGRPILGSHKTWRGLIFGSAAGIGVFSLQAYLDGFEFFGQFALIDYQSANVLWSGFLLSFGALFGDMLFSFFKRRLNIAPGKSFLPFDQIDYVVGAFLLTSPYLRLELSVWITLTAATFVLHILVNRIGYEIGISENKW